MSNDIGKLLSGSVADGSLSAAAHSILSLPDLGAKIQQGLGISVDDVPASEVFLLNVLIDDSFSIRSAGNEPLVREGYNTILAALIESKQESGILIHTRYLNGTVLCPYTPVANAARLDATNYQATGGTPLYDETVAILGTVIAKTQEFADAGVPVRTVTVIITDGADWGSRKQRPASVRLVVSDMLKSENHIVAAVGIDDGSTDFRRVFTSMGIDDRWILTPKADKSDIRAAFHMISQSAVRASQARGRFSQAAAGGFGA